MGTSLHLDCTTSAGAGQAKVKRRAVAVLVYLAAISGRSFFSAVVSTLEEVTAYKWPCVLIPPGTPPRRRSCAL